jgi:CspA family cold shock protein
LIGEDLEYRFPAQRVHLEDAPSSNRHERRSSTRRWKSHFPSVCLTIWRAKILCGQTILENAKMAKGTVKWFNPTKGYGFIQPAGGGGKDVFVHISAVERAGLSSLNEGQVVEYEIVENRGKAAAENLKVSR